MGIEGIGAATNPLAPSNDDEAPKLPPHHGETVEAHPGAPQWEPEHMSALRDFRSQVGGAVDKLAQQHADPTGLTPSELRNSALVPALQKLSGALGSMSDGAVSAELEDAVHRSWPGTSPEDAHEAATRLTGAVREHAKYDAAFGMRDTAVAVMKDAGAKLDTLAKDPQRLSQLADRMRAMPAAQEKSLRTKLGLEDAKLEPQEMSAKISERAKLLDRQADELSKAGGDRIFRAMSDHNVIATFMKQHGLQPDSLAGKQVLAAREQGVSDKEDLEHMKLACGFAASVMTGGLAAAGVAGLATSAAGSIAMNAGDVMEKYRAIDTARAGESAGTMYEGVTDDSVHNFHVAFGAAAGEAAFGGLAAEHLAEPINEELIHSMSKEAAHFISHGGSEGAVNVAVDFAEHAASKEIK